MGCNYVKRLLDWLMYFPRLDQFIVYMDGNKKKIAPLLNSLHVPAERSFPREIFDNVPRLVHISACRSRWIREA